MVVSLVADIGLGWLICTRARPSRWPRCLDMVSPGASDSDGTSLRGGTSFHMMASHSKRTDMGISQGSPWSVPRERLL